MFIMQKIVYSVQKYLIVFKNYITFVKKKILRKTWRRYFLDIYLVWLTRNNSHYFFYLQQFQIIHRARVRKKVRNEIKSNY